jgi:hypothetical protein
VDLDIERRPDLQEGPFAKRIQPEEDAALLDEVASVDAERGLGGLVDPILPRWRVPQLLVRQVEGVNRRVDHPLHAPPRGPPPPRLAPCRLHRPPLIGPEPPPRSARATAAAAMRCAAEREERRLTRAGVAR